MHDNFRRLYAIWANEDERLRKDIGSFIYDYERQVCDDCNDETKEQQKCRCIMDNFQICECLLLDIQSEFAARIAIQTSRRKMLASLRS